MSVSNLNFGISLNKRFVLRLVSSILLQLMHLLLLPFANLVSTLHQGHQVTITNAKVKWYSFTRYQAPGKAEAEMKINIHVLSMVRLFLVLLQEGASLPSPNTNEDKQGVFPCITNAMLVHSKETRFQKRCSENYAFPMFGSWLIG